MLGISTFCLHHEPLESALDAIAPLTDVIEIMDDGLHYVEDDRLLSSYSHRFILHAPSRGVNIASLLEPIRRASVEVTGRCCAIAGSIGGSVVIHPGYFAWAEERQKAERQLQRSLHEITAHAEEYSVGFSIENMGNWDYFFLKCPDELPLLEGAPFCLDIGHAHLNHCLEGFLATPLRHVHLHDNDGQSDTHLPLGDGTIAIDPVIDAIRRDHATTTIEVSTLDGVLATRERLSRLGL